MERSINPGDYVILTHGADSNLYSIEQITPAEIGVALVTNVTQKRVLLPKNGEWVVGGATVKYKIEFRSREDVPQLLFTRTHDVDIQILNELDDKTLSLTCQLDKYAASLCSTDDLWRKRVIKYFGDKASLREAPMNIDIIQIRGDNAGTFFVTIGQTFVAVFNWQEKRFVPLNSDQQKLARDLIGYKYDLSILPRITEFMDAVAEEIPKKKISITVAGIGKTNLYIMTVPPTNFVMINPTDPEIVAFFDGEDFVPLSTEQIQSAKLLNIKYVPGKIPTKPENFKPPSLPNPDSR